MIAPTATATTDRVLEKFSSARKSYRDRNGYKAAESSRFMKRPTSPFSDGSSGDQHFRSEYQYHLMAERAEELDRNDIVAGQAMDRLVCNVLQHGFTLDPQTGDKEADKILKEEWDEYTQDPERCDIQGEFDFNTLSWIAMRSMNTRGDIASIPLQDERIQLVENYRLRSPTSTKKRIVFGVEMDSDRRPVAYHFTKDDIDVFRSLKSNETARFPVRDEQGNKQVFLHKVPKRISLTRGVTLYSPVMHAFGMHDDIQFAKMIQQQMVSCITFVRQRELGFDLDGDEAVYWDHRSEPDPCREGQMRPVKDLAPASWYTTWPGEDLRVLGSNVPNPTFFDHAKQMQQLIGLNFGLPLILFLMDASETNFSGWRGAVDQAKIGFKEFQRNWSRSWYSPHYLLKLRAWSDSPIQRRSIARIFRRIGPAVFKHRWIHPVWEYIEPLKDIQADTLELRAGLNSPRRVQERRSRDWEVVHREIVEDNAKLIRLAKKEAAAINLEFGNNDPVTWREVANLATPEGTQINLAPDQGNRKEPVSAEN